MRTVPFSPAEITVDWLNSVVGGGPFTSVDVEPLSTQGMYGSQALLVACNARGAQRFFCKFASASEEAREARGKEGFYRNEHAFYTRMSAQFPIRVPRCHFAHYDPSAHHTLLLIDYVEGEFGNHVRGANRAQAELAMETAARLHCHWADPNRLDRHTWLTPIADSDFVRSFATIDEPFVHRALNVLGDLAPPWFRRHAPRTAAILAAQVSALGQLPPTLIHGDFHVANMCFQRTELTLLDWQTVFRGPGIWDVCTFIDYSLSVDDRRAWQDELLRGYLGVERIPDWAHDAVRRMALYLAFNMVRNAPVFEGNNDPGVAALLQVIMQRCCAMVEDNDALELID